MTSYDSKSRQALTVWAREQHQHLIEGHFLMRSPLVAMGVGAASAVLALLGIRMYSHSSRADFEARLQSAVSAPKPGV